MPSFIAQIVDTLLGDAKCNARKTAIVFSTRRAGVYFKEMWAMKTVGADASWVPKIFSIEDFAAHLAGVPVIDRFGAVCELFKVVSEDRQFKKCGIPDTFAKFYEWGNLVVREFDDIDANLADCSKLFNALNDTIAIEEWGEDDINKFDASAHAQAYNGIRTVLPRLYSAFHASLAAKNTCTQGHAFRKAVENLRKNSTTDTWDTVIFAGFNALTNSEKEIMNLYSEKNGHFFWDMDTYFTENDAQEAGSFFRKYKKEKFNTKSDYSHSESLIHDPSRKIEIIGVADRESQAKTAGNILSRLISEGEFVPERTAIVLADESLLFPMLNSIPPEITNINITMGYPIRFTPLYTLLNAYITLHDNIRRMQTGGAFYYKDIVDVLTHPYVLTAGRKTISEHIATIKEHKRIYVGEDDLKGCVQEIPLCRALLRPIEDFQASVEIFKTILTELRANFVKNDKRANALEFEYIFAVYTMLARVSGSIKKAGIRLERDDFFLVLKEMLTHTTIPFTGEPVKGLQIMGYLETRALDFDTVIMVSVNEGIIPAGKSTDGFIPNDIQVANGLPTYRDKDAISAYHFYRLLKRTKKAYYIYNTVSEGLGKGERSRFIEQLLYEYAPKYPGSVTSVMAVMKAERIVPTPIAYTHTSESIAKICDRKFSPSAVNTFLTCTLKFYFQYVLGIREYDEMKENPDASVRGNIFHHAINVLYSPYKSKTQALQSDDFKQMRGRISHAVDEAYTKELGETVVLTTGINYINKIVIEKQLKRLLDADEKFACENGRQVFVIGLEEALEREIEIGDGKKMKLQGKLDRYDRVKDSSGEWNRVIDYKTGVVKSLSIDAISAIITSSSLDTDAVTDGKDFKYGFAVQLLWYWFLLHESGMKTKSGIAKVQAASTGVAYLKMEKTELELTDNHVADFEELLKIIFSRMTDPQMIFEQTSCEKNCNYCSCLDICTRKESSW